MKTYLLLCLLLSSSVTWSQTKILFSFDTEDYTCDRSNDAIRDLANLLTEEGVRGNFNIVGYLANRLTELKRTDVIEALRPHVIGSQTFYHSRHPDIAEMGDDADYSRAYARSYEDGKNTVDALERLFGKGCCVFWCPPGDSVSPVAMDAYVDLGVVLSGGCGMTKDGRSACYSGSLIRSGSKVGGLWYFNQLHIPYCTELHLESMLPPAWDNGRPRPLNEHGDNGRPRPLTTNLDEIAKYDVLCLYMHPHMAVKKAHWDGPNYRGGNLVKWGEWKQVEDRDPEDTRIYYERLRAFIRALKSDPRFRITDFEALKAGIAPRRRITAAALPAIRAALEKDFDCIRTPASWSVADVFQAVVRLLRGEKEYTPGKVYGFLARPEGVKEPVEVSAADLRAAAKTIDLTTFLPASIQVGERSIGPADFLFAALEVLTTGAERVCLSPREQLGAFKNCPGIEKRCMAGRWVHTPEFKDTYLSERLRLQLWTLRIDDSEVTPIPLGAAANTARTDVNAADGKGGWLDSGTHDLHVLKPGVLEFCGVPFEIPEEQDESAKTCLVFGRKDMPAASATLDVSGTKGDYLYLLHAAADTNPKKRDLVGSVILHYTDGSRKVQHIRAGRDVGNWTEGRSYSRSFKAWTMYNDNTQVSLFATPFVIDSSKTLARVELRHEGVGKWMILAAARGDERRLKGLIAPLSLTTKFEVPDGFAEPPKDVRAGQKPRNVILIIGDGMGEGSVRFASSYCRGDDHSMLPQRLPVYGHCRTVSVEGKTTDSAAAATAIATGFKTMNGMVGMRATSDAERKTAKPVISFAERGHAKGLAVGLLSNDPITSATPAGFYAHVRGRGEADLIAQQAIGSGYEVLIGPVKSAATFSKLPKIGYSLVKTKDEIASVPASSKVLGFFKLDADEKELSRTVSAVLARLESTERPFFLMAECATPDHGNHGNNPKSTVFGVVQLDWMTKVAVDYAMKRGDTLVIVTADHETGGVSTAPGKNGRPQIVYSATSHTERPVALYAYGPGAELFRGDQDNTDICKKIEELKR